MLWLTWILIAAAALAVLWLGLLALGNWRWQQRSAALLADLAARARPCRPAAMTPAFWPTCRPRCSVFSAPP